MESLQLRSALFAYCRPEMIAMQAQKFLQMNFNISSSQTSVILNQLQRSKECKHSSDQTKENITSPELLYNANLFKDTYLIYSVLSHRCTRNRMTNLVKQRHCVNIIKIWTYLKYLHCLPGTKRTSHILEIHLVGEKTVSFDTFPIHQEVTHLFHYNSSHQNVLLTYLDYYNIQ